MVLQDMTSNILNNKGKQKFIGPQTGQWSLASAKLLQFKVHCTLPNQPWWQVIKMELIQFAKAFQENLVLITSSTQSLGQHSLRQPWQPGKKHCTRIPKYQQLQPYLIYCIGWYQKNSSTFQALLLNTHLNSSNHCHWQISQYIITKFCFRSFKYRDQHHYHRLRPPQHLQSRERRCISVRLEFPLQPFYLSGNLFCLRKPGQLGSQSSGLVIIIIIIIITHKPKT